MNKKKLLILSLLTLHLSPFTHRLSTLMAQTTYFSTDFEADMPEGMTFYDLDENEPSIDMKNLGFAIGTPWIVSAPADEDGNHVGTSTSWYRKGATSNDWMILPAVTVDDAKAKLLWRSRASDKDYRDGLVLYVALSTQQPGQPQPSDFDTTAPLFSINKEEHAWQQHEVDLSAYMGQTIYIAFVNNSKDKTMLYVDDIFVGIPSNVGLKMGFDRCFDGYGEVTISGQAIGTGTQAVEQFTIGFELVSPSGERLEGAEQTFNHHLAPGETFDFTLDQPVTLQRNQLYHYRAWIRSGDDQSVISGKFYAIPWKLVCEEVTGTWCQYCVRGLGAMNYMRENYPDGFIGIGIHNNGYPQSVPDSMAIEGEQYLSWLMSSYSMGGFPNCVMNRNTSYSIDPGNIPYYYINIKKYDRHEAGIQARAAYDPATGEITVNAEALFTKDYEEANFRLFYVVIENNVHRTHAETGILDNYCGYDQINGYAGNVQGECYGYEKLPGILNADDMWYNDVARGTWPKDDFRGIANVFPRQISDGDIYEYECAFPLPEKIHHIENCEVVVMLLDKDGRFMNADKVELTAAIPGDVNGDGEVGIGDIVAITNVMAGITTDAAVKTRADVNGDGEVGIGDIVAITNIMAGVL
ncbi:MAG: choice-of-anchor J domain-containing protein [Prevotella sp.]|nr:choice-of-anchor J domain-containing protein [Prevotella sp.]